MIRFNIKFYFCQNFKLNLIMNLSDNIVFENELKAAYYDMIEEYTPKYYKGFEKDLEELILNKKPLPELFYKVAIDDEQDYYSILKDENLMKMILPYPIGVILVYNRKEEYNNVKYNYLNKKIKIQKNWNIAQENYEYCRPEFIKINEKYNELIKYYTKEMENYFLKYEEEKPVFYIETQRIK